MTSELSINRTGIRNYQEIHTCKTDISSLIEMSGDEGIYLRLLFQCVFTDTCNFNGLYVPNNKYDYILYQCGN